MPRENLICLEPGCRFAEAKRPFSESRFLINHYRSAHKGGIEAGRRAVAKQRKAALDADALADAPNPGVLGLAKVVAEPDKLLIPVDRTSPGAQVDVYLGNRIEVLSRDIARLETQRDEIAAILARMNDELSRTTAAKEAYTKE